MKYKIIDGKSKEIYCNLQPIQEESKLVASRFEFWNNMNHIAMQNMMVQQFRRA